MLAKIISRLTGQKILHVTPKCTQRRFITRPTQASSFRHQSFCAKRCEHGSHDSSNNHYSRLVFALPLVALLAAKAEKTQELELTKEDLEIAELIQKGQRMLRTKCSPAKVEELYIKALHIALSTRDHSKIAYMQDQLANLALRTGQLQKAEELFKNVIQNIIASGKKDDDPAVLEVSLKLATIYASLGKIEFADSGYSWVIETSRKNAKELAVEDFTDKANEEKYKNQLALLGMTLDSYGRFLFYQGRNEQALATTREAASIGVELFGEKDIRTLVLQNDIGAILNQMGKGVEAVEIIQKAISASKGTTEHYDTAVFWVNLAHIHQSQGETEKARDAFQHAAKEAELSKDSGLQAEIKKMSDSGP